VNVFRFVPGYTSVIYDEGKEPLFLLLVAFIVTFCLTRGYTRLARRRGWGSGSVRGVHLHHVVPGIMLVLLSGLVAFTRVGPDEIVRELCAIAFGVGAALVLDEFALVFYLQDVYWSEEGRDSVDATILGLMVAALLLAVSEPFRLEEPLGHPGRLAFFVVVAANVVFAIAACLKGKLFAGTAAILVPPVAWVAAFRLAKPGSPWARWFYDPDRGSSELRELRARKRERAARRAETDPGTRFLKRLVTIVGGEPSRGSRRYG
jgi:lysyl-tRNA synthetase class 2